MRSAARSPFPSEVASLLPGLLADARTGPIQAGDESCEPEDHRGLATVSPPIPLGARSHPVLRSGMAPMPSGAHQGVNRSRSRSTAATVGGSLEAGRGHRDQLNLNGDRSPCPGSSPLPSSPSCPDHRQLRRALPILALAAGGRRHRGLDQVPPAPFPAMVRLPLSPGRIPAPGQLSRLAKARQHGPAFST